MDFVVSDDHSVKVTENEKNGKYLDLSRELKTIQHESGGDTSCNRCARNSQQRIGKWSGRIVDKMMSGDHLDYRSFKICQNTKKSPGDLWRPVVTQTPMKDHQLMFVWKILKWVK